MNAESPFKLSFTTLALLLVLAPLPAAFGQAKAPGTTAMDVPKGDLSIGYNFIRSNAPPGGCQCFDTGGGYASGSLYFKRWLSVEGEVTGQHQDNIGNLGQNLTLLTFVGGPKIQYPGHRLVPFGEVLVGGAHGSDSYFPTGNTFTTSATSVAVSAGGGLQINLTGHIALRAFDVQYLYTHFPNGTDDSQHHLDASAGIVFKFGVLGSKRIKTPPVAPEMVLPETRIALSCSSSVSSLDEGDTLEILGNTLTEPAKVNVTFEWLSTVGRFVGTGRRVLLDTQGVPPGSDHVIGRATAFGKEVISADCDIPFRIKTAEQALSEPTKAPVLPSVDKGKLIEFHENVPDALFDYNSAAIRPDTQAAINHAAVYLQNHPEIGVLVGGFADDRGASTYNLKLGERRAEAARKALIDAGVAPDRVQIVSYGKEVQVCTSEDENCRQQNRRAAFNMHP
jgi:outer membrane protein OmpA-like peptidoglycan-associated protein/opacity protein-like surface antigen